MMYCIFKVNIDYKKAGARGRARGCASGAGAKGQPPAGRANLRHLKARPQGNMAAQVAASTRVNRYVE